MRHKKAKTILALAFAALAGIALVKGYTAQSKAGQPPNKTAYSYTPPQPAKDGKAAQKEYFSGRVGTDERKFEYRVSDFASPKVYFTAKPDSETVFGAKADLKKGRYGFYTSAKLEHRTILNARTEFGQRTRSSVYSINSSPDDWFFDSWGLKYSEFDGRKHRKELDIEARIKLFGKKYDLTTNYNVNTGSINFNTRRYS
jgi:hypothetical protein